MKVPVRVFQIPQKSFGIDHSQQLAQESPGSIVRLDSSEDDLSNPYCLIKKELWGVQSKRPPGRVLSGTWSFHGLGEKATVNGRLSAHALMEPRGCWAAIQRWNGILTWRTVGRLAPRSPAGSEGAGSQDGGNGWSPGRLEAQLAVAVFWDGEAEGWGTVRSSL